MHRFAIPILNRTVIIDDNFGRVGKEKSKILDDDVLVMKVRTSLFSFMLTAGSEHASSGGIVGAPNYFAQKNKLTCSNHITDTRDVVEKSSYFLIADMVVLNFDDGDTEDMTDVTMKEYFQTSKKCLAE